MKVVIFGFEDTIVGQMMSFLASETSYSVPFFISTSAIPHINIEDEHKKRPNNKTEFVRDGSLYSKDLIVTTDYVELLKENKIDCALILEDSGLKRAEIYDTLKSAGIKIMTFIHSTAFVGQYTDIGEGSIIFPSCHIGYKSDIGVCSILQTNCLIEHHNRVGSFCNLSPRVTTGGFTKIDDYSRINMSVDLINKISIGKHTTIGAGSLVLEDCDQRSLYFGRPARLIRRL